MFVSVPTKFYFKEVPTTEVKLVKALMKREL